MKKMLLLLFIVTSLSYGSLFAEEVHKGNISGKLMIKDGGPMSGGIVIFFNEQSGPPPAHNKYWRVPDDIAEINEDGSFSAELLEGNYYIGAIKRISGDNVGPPREGDYFFMSQDKNGDQVVHYVKEGEDLNLGVLSGAVPFESKTAEDITAIEGIILDIEGNAVEGTIVFAYITPAMTGPPLFVSDRTKDDGKYTLRVHEGGTYYLRVRDAYGGGPPHGGALISGYKASSVTVKASEIKKGINITVKRRDEGRMK